MTDHREKTFFGKLRRCFRDGIAKGLRTSWWLLRFMIPISLGVAFLKWAGVLGVIAKWVKPLFGFLGLPGEAAVAFVTAALLNVYSGIAAMEPMGLDARQTTILGLMILITHNLPIEGVVQSKAGAAGVRLIFLRIAASFVMAAVLNFILPAGEAAHVTSQTAIAVVRPEFWAAMREWAVGGAWLIGKICLFVMGVMILQRILEEFKLMALLGRILKWPLAAIGLPSETVFLWVIANSLGLAYGAAVIVEESRSGKLSKKDVQIINISVGVCHSLLEDTLLLVAVGAWAFWITAPRIMLAGLAVWAFRAWIALRGTQPRECGNSIGCNCNSRDPRIETPKKDSGHRSSKC